MPFESHIQRTASKLLRRYGVRALEEARVWSRHFAEAGEPQERRVWTRIAWQVRASARADDALAA